MALAWTSVGLAEEVEFRSDVLPLLSEYCFHCHGPDAATRKGGLRLDRRDDALAPAESGHPAIIPGKSAESPLIRRLLSHDPELVMPPPETKKSLPSGAVDVLRRWIDQGAIYQNHWAFEPVTRPEVPPAPPAATVRNPIDHFILAGLAAADLKPSPEASKTTLLRRVSLDLTGLPPTPAEIEAFLADPAPDAYERVVDRLLASPHYGEKMSLPWLDAARYADSNGFQQDGDNFQYVWRDWVVRALNENMPFDRFATEQLAGDLLPSPTTDQLVATAFNRNHLLNGEGGAIPEEQRNVILFDRVDVTTTTFLGLTVACAQCHDHKYDPLPQRDYYRMMAFFNHVPETGQPAGSGQYRIADPWIHAGPPEAMDQLARLRETARQAATASPELLAEADAWSRSLQEKGLPAWEPLSPTTLSAGHEVVLTLESDASITASGPAPDRNHYTLQLPALDFPITALRIEAIPDPRLPHGGSGRADSGNSVLSRLLLSHGSEILPLFTAFASHTQGGFDPLGILDENPETGWAYHPDVARPHTLVVALAQPLAPGTATTLALQFDSRHPRHQFGRFRLSATAAPDAILAAGLPAEITRSLAQGKTPPAETLRKYYIDRSSHPLALARRQILATAEKALRDHEASLPRVMVMSDARPRKTHIYDRGNYLSPLEEVSPGTPECLPPMAADLPANRLGLARWLFSPDHPLTARVQVNRYWQTFFGTGIVKSPENLGVQAEPPSHPELLDWLADEFRRSGWNPKHLHRLIVTSATYRQAARVTPELLDRDPANVWLARAPRPRLPAMLLRDLALSSSGLLDPRLGGKPVYPYQPAGIWNGLAITQERDFTYPTSTGSDLHRRSLYTFWRRTVAPGNMFDASPRQICSVKPSLTNTPLHALTTLNDPTWVEAARALAIRCAGETASNDPATLLSRAFLHACSRPIRPEELQVLLRSHAAALEHFRAQPAAAREFLSQGVAATQRPLPEPELAALAAVCLSIFNLDEALTRG
jgi:hypothetical protein